MVEIGGRPILWHIMKIYAAAGVTDFVILPGHKGSMIKEYFSNYFLHTSDVTFDLATGTAQDAALYDEPWSVTLLDTGARHDDRRSPVAVRRNTSATTRSVSPTVTGLPT